MNFSASVLAIAATVVAAIGLQAEPAPSSPSKPASQRVFTIKRLPAGLTHQRHGEWPRLRIRESTSTNWSGYAVPKEGTAGDTFTAVTGSWTVPTVTGASRSDTYSATWVGLDGYDTATVEQTGTEQDWNGRAQENYVWFEMYPAGSYEIEGFPANPGDVFTASVQYAGTTTVKSGRTTETEQVFTITISNTTQGVSYTIPASYTTTPTAERASAEWVVEAPSTNRGVLPIADFHTAYFTQCYATSLASGEKPVSIGSGIWTPDPLTMEDGSSGIATPSALTEGGSAFSVTWSQ